MTTTVAVTVSVFPKYFSFSLKNRINTRCLLRKVCACHCQLLEQFLVKVIPFPPIFLIEK